MRPVGYVANNAHTGRHPQESGGCPLSSLPASRSHNASVCAICTLAVSRTPLSYRDVSISIAIRQWSLGPHSSGEATREPNVSNLRPHWQVQIRVHWKCAESADKLWLTGMEPGTVERDGGL